jgi:preprotein translocase subunit SecE
MKKIKIFLKSLNYEFKQITWLTKKEIQKIFLGVCVGLVILLTVVILGNLLGYFTFNKLFI